MLEETDKPDVQLEPPNGNEHPSASNLEQENMCIHECKIR